MSRLNENRGEHKSETMLASALAYAARGWPVFPCKPRDKTPFTVHGLKDATTDATTIKEWFRRWREANLAIATGYASGLVGLDIDPRHGGHISLDLLEHEHAPLPETVESLTGGGGRHLLFTHPGGLVKNSSGVVGLGLDIKADGGYIIAPPSLHESGKSYEWEATHGPDDVEIAPLPPWLLALLRASSNGKEHARPAPPPGVLQNGTVHHTFVSWAGAMHAKGMSPAAIEAALQHENTTRCDPVRPAENIRKIVESVTTLYEPGHLPQGEHERWPVLAEEAFSGIAGEITRAIDPYTEADQAATLLNLLAAFGSCVGSAPHACVQHDKHTARLNAVFVGDTSKGRKGTSWSAPRYLFSLCDPDWVKNCIKSGLSSAEGLIHNVRDARYKKQPIKEKGRVVDYQDVLEEEAVEDKRLLIVESEFASTLTVMGREGNTLSSVIRQAWDHGDLSTLTRNSPLKATNAHISIIGHITKTELLAQLDETHKANGFANRFLWALVRRSKELPEGAIVPDSVLHPLAQRLFALIAHARTSNKIERDEEAKELWASVYHDLSEGRPGLLGAVISRAEAYVLRLSLLYSLLADSTVIKVDHLKAALAVWEYCEDSAALIFGQKLGDATADRILEAIRNAPEGISDNDIHELFDHHKSANERARAVSLLLSLGLITATQEKTGGRPRTVYMGAR